MNKSRQRFWELAGSKLGDILGVEKTAEQVIISYHNDDMI
jgi:pre-mRNA-splicing factor ATP-dependent RNA helicase DHX38/PRP16